MKEKIEHTRQEYGIRKQAAEFPMMCVISFVYICNSRCPNCPYNNSNIKDSYKDSLIMPEHILKKIADDCGQYNAYIRVSGGGEPMLHPQATYLFIYAKNKGAKVGLITNGSKFNKENLTALIEAGIDNIEVSVDAGDENTYKRVRTGLDWRRLNKNVEMAVNIREDLKSNTRIIVSVINQKGVDVEAAKKYWDKLVDKVQIRKYLTWGYNKNESADPTPYLPPEKRIPCPWLFERLNIDTRGDVTLCGEDIAFNEKFDNIMKKSIKEIWCGEKFNFFREKHLSGCGDEISICGRCPDWQYRSWNYNYWKVIKDAEKSRKYKLLQV